MDPDHDETHTHRYGSQKSQLLSGHSDRKDHYGVFMSSSVMYQICCFSLSIGVAASSAEI